MVRGFIPDGLRSSPSFGAASQPIGDKSPHHRARSYIGSVSRLAKPHDNPAICRFFHILSG